MTLHLTECRGGEPVRSSYVCAFCGRHGARHRVWINPPDQSTELYRWYCDVTCLCNHGTGQEPPPRQEMLL